MNFQGSTHQISMGGFSNIFLRVCVNRIESDMQLKKDTLHLSQKRPLRFIER